MLPVKLIMVGLLLSVIGTAIAWDEETGYAEGEYVEIEFSEWMSEWLSHKDRQSPAWYNPIKQFFINIARFFIGEQADTEIDFNITTTRERWDGDSYESDGTQATFSDTLTTNPNNTQTDCINPNPVEEYFKNNTDALDNFITRDDDPEHPDILNVTVDIEGEGVDIEDYGYVTLDNNDLQEIEDDINNPDYGFALDGRGSGGGSGSIYEGINMYGASGTGDTTGMGASFNVIFWCLIPLIFILAVMKLSSRVMK